MGLLASSSVGAIVTMSRGAGPDIRKYAQGSGEPSTSVQLRSDNTRQLRDQGEWTKGTKQADVHFGEARAA